MKMLELIKQNAVPAAVVRSAARGALSVPSQEMIEILVYLTRNPVVGGDAKMTLAGWDEASANAALSSNAVPQEVLDYFWSEENRRPRLMPALIENSRITEQQLAQLAAKASREVVVMLLASPRVQISGEVLGALLNNAQLTPAEAQQVQSQLGAGAPEPVDAEAETAHDTWTQEHAAEIAAEEGKAFELVAPLDEAETAVPAAVATEMPATPLAAQRPVRKVVEPLKLSTLQRLARMNVAQRVKVAFLGSKEERVILVRDGARIVQSAVLASPKLSELEVETFASQKNLAENVLREIARSRRFMKSYTIIKNLVNNPKCPLDISLTLLKNLLVMDLKILQGNRNVPDTVRKVAMKMYKEKSTPPGQRPE
jgi:hypothetical protein